MQVAARSMTSRGARQLRSDEAANEGGCAAVEERAQPGKQAGADGRKSWHTPAEIGVPPTRHAVRRPVATRGRSPTYRADRALIADEAAIALEAAARDDPRAPNSRGAVCASARQHGARSPPALACRFGQRRPRRRANSAAPERRRAFLKQKAWLRRRPRRAQGSGR
jgi:hypothetical protein